MKHVDTLYGNLFIPDIEDDLITKALIAYGEWGATEVRLASHFVKESDHVWDVGAYLGTFGLGVNRLTKPSSIVSFEANNKIFPFLKKNCEQVKNGAITTVNIGVWDTKGWLIPEVTDKRNLGSQVFKESNGLEKDSVQCSTLSDLRKIYGDYHLLKLDIEGSELNALQGDVEYLKSAQPTLWVECNEDKKSLQIMNFLKSLDYDIWYFAFPAFRINNFKKNSDLLYPMAYEAALLAVAPAYNGLPCRFEENIIAKAIQNPVDLTKALYDTPRWCKQSWLHLSRAELIARLGRMTRGESILDFLNS